VTIVTRKAHLDLTANPTPAERRRLIAEDLVIAALPIEGEGLRGVVIPRQAVQEGGYAGAFLCPHRHDNLTGALTCANKLANKLTRYA